MKNKKTEISNQEIIFEYNFLKNLRENVFNYLSTPGMTLEKLSEMSDIPLASLRTFLYGNTKDCKLSTVAYLSRSIGIGIDELAGLGTLSDDVIKNIQICRELPPNAVHLINWYIEYQHMLYQKTPKNKTIISVMQPICNGNGNMKIQDLYKKLDITNIELDIRSKVFFGIKIPCDHYMPFYSHYDVALIANDRDAGFHEDALILNDGSLFFAKRKMVNGEAKLYGIRDNQFRRNEKETDMVIGYVAQIIHSPNFEKET